MRLRLLMTWLLIGSPTIAAIAYFGFIAADRYVSEAQFVVRTAARPVGGAGLGAVLQMAGLGRAQDEVFSVQSFMTSRNAVAQLADRVPLQDYYNRTDADPIARYPSFAYGATSEELYNYLQWMITTIYSSATGITTLRVQAFRGEDAQTIALHLLDLGEEAVNRMNARIHADAARIAEAAVARDEERLVAAQVAITQFRNAELLIDPAASSIVVTELIARLGAELAQTEAQMREVSASAATNPQLPSLRRRIEALQAQIMQERQRISSEEEGLADSLARYERLVLNREFAKQALSASVRSLETAQQEARRQQLYLERVVEPIAVDHASAPQRLRMIATIFGLNLIILLVGWLTYTGLREHAVRP